ncbi:ATP-binding protein [Dactylosporangium sp. NPDC051484]|uniref:sensor histidine kinase n=1 Tax=Dactylosporangium sp. NPDC051484 TaxID=3154942 RepID=UPI00344F326D
MTTRGTLRVYLGAAPGVGKTYRMLEEGRRRLNRGTDVVVGFVETHDRPFTQTMLDGLEVVPRRDLTYRGAAFTELDLDALLARRPEVALVDELAHTNVPGSEHAKRWRDVDVLLDAGIDVLTTVNIQHLESLNDVVERITGVTQRETVPDAVVRRAEQIELVDMTPEALRRRMAHGNIYKPEKIDAALGNYFRVGNLTALRELALLWLADKVDEQLDHYRAAHDIDKTWEARERVVVALTGGPEGDTLIRRAARVAARTKGADLLAVHVVRGDGLAGADPANLTRQRLLVEALGGTYHQVLGADVPGALLDFARGVNATQLVLGASRRGRLAQILSPGVGVTTTAESGSIDVHLVTHEQARRFAWRSPRAAALTRGRRLTGLALALAGLPALTLGLDAARADMALTSDILAYLVLAVATALVGGLLPALVCAIGGFLLLNWCFTPPLNRFTIAERENLFALVAFVFVAVAVATVVDRAARRARDAARASAEARTLSTLAGSVLHGDNPLDALLERVRESFGLTCVTLLDRESEHDPWRPAASVGGTPCLTPADGETEVPVEENVSLVLRGHPLPAEARRLVEAFAAHAAIALRQQRLAERAAAAGTLAEVDRLRTALLSAVSHDLRTPLASAKAAVGSLRSPDVRFCAEDEAELLATAEESLDKLTRLVENLLDMSRLQAGALALTLQPVDLADALPRAADDLDAAVVLSVPEELPEVIADPALLERILVNLLGNALRYSPPGRPPSIGASEHAGLVDIRVVDHGPGIPAADHDRVFQPFQRLGDRDNATGVGLGLALSRGLAEAMGGTLVPEPTPGGGLTMTLTLHRA